MEKLFQNGWNLNLKNSIDSVCFYATVKEGQCVGLRLALTYDFGLGSEHDQINVQTLLYSITYSFIIINHM